MKTKFNEKQKFTQWWLWLLVFIVESVMFYGMYVQLIVGEKFGTKHGSDLELILVNLFVFSVFAFIGVMQLKTEIDETEINISFFPFLKRKEKWTEVKKAEIVNYGFVGGWGIRISSEYGKVYNTKGKIGLAVELKNGQKFLIGTQKDTELKKVLAEIIKS